MLEGIRKKARTKLLIGGILLVTMLLMYFFVAY